MVQGPENYVSVETLTELETSSAKKRTAKCKRLGSNASKQERAEAHKLKMARKAAVRAKQGPTGYGLPVRPNRSAKWNNRSDTV